MIVTQVTSFKTIQGTEVILPKHFIELVGNTDNNYIAMIRFVRAHYDIGLKDAKDIVDYIRQNKHIWQMP